MKRILIPIGLLLSCTLLYGQLSVTENYIQSRTYLEPVTSSSSTARQIQTIQYMDGFERPKQLVSVKSSPEGKDVVTPILYDGFGRQTRNYLPIPQQGTNNGAIYAQQSSSNFPVGDPTGIYSNERPFSEKILESSPLNRVLQQRQEGIGWDDKPVQFGYGANTTADAVKKYTVVTTWVDGATYSQLSQSINYGTAQLYKNSITDEDGNVTIEFKNGQGQIILVRKVISDTDNADTYYVYNEYNQLAFVIPPKAAVEANVNSYLDDLCYQYKYDARSRLVEKKVPGKGWEYMVYDKQDRVVLSQDTVLKTTTNNTFGKKGWLFTKYDALGRIVYTGFFTNSANRSTMQSAINNMTANAANNEVRSATAFTLNGMDVYYTKNAFPTGSMIILSVNYYDTYPLGTPAIPTQILGQDLLTQDAQSSVVSTKSLPVAFFVKNVENDNWTKNYTWYDKKGRSIGTYSINHLGGYTKTESLLDFAGVIQQKITTHRRLSSDTDKIITENYTYDHQNRLLVHTHQVDNNPVEYLSQNSYNELSQLQTKKVGGISLSNSLQQVDYQYNIRGWITNINDPDNLGNDLFGYKINYNQVQGLQTPNSDYPDLKVLPRYNGNISEVVWRTLTEENGPLKRYGYVYDRLNRLSAGFYQNDSNPSAKEYFEIANYDFNGNILRMKRSEGIVPGNSTPAMIDNLRYDYLGNKLTKVTEEQTGNNKGYPYLTSHNTITYDNDNGNIGNGNMTSHNDKGISAIQYNFLNLPKQITQNGAVTGFIYRADGVKIKKQSGNVETHYLDGFQYKSTFAIESWNGQGTFHPDPNEVPVMKLRIIPTSEGYYDALLNQYIYNFTDHLGNVRLSYTDTNKDNIIQPRGYFGSTICNGPFFCFEEWKPGEIVESVTYYPFGLMHDYNATTRNAYQYKYNGKELQENGTYDYGARFYMPDIGRWGVVDPLAEQYRRFSPYNYAVNNPIRFIDPDGRGTEDWIKKDGTWLYDPNVTTERQAQQMAGVSGFAKNGTIVKYGEDGNYARLKEGGDVDWLPNDTIEDMVTNTMAVMGQSLGGNSASTWGTDPQEFPQITNTGNEMTRTDFDPSTHDKLRAGDKTFTLDWGSFVVPSTFPADGSKGGPTWAGRIYAGTWVFDRVADLYNLHKGSDIDTLKYKMGVFDYNAGKFKDTTIILQYSQKVDFSVSNTQQTEKVDSISLSNLSRYFNKK